MSGKEGGMGSLLDDVILALDLGTASLCGNVRVRHGCALSGELQVRIGSKFRSGRHGLALEAFYQARLRPTSELRVRHGFAQREASRQARLHPSSELCVRHGFALEGNLSRRSLRLAARGRPSVDVAGPISKLIRSLRALGTAVPHH
jgi:hypothetical protein